MSARFVALAVIIAIAAGGAGYWLGYARHPAGGQPSDNGHGRILYYRNPMGQPDTSPVPKKDSMGMGYIPVYEHDVSTMPGTVTVDLAKIQRAGVRTEPAMRRILTQDVTAPGVVRFNEDRVAVASPRVEGWVERVYVGAVGVPVKAGQPLVDIYSPDLVQAQEEYFLARRAPANMDGAGALAQGALDRMKSLGLSDDQIRQLSTGTAPRRTIAIPSPLSGVVSEKNAVLGQKFMPGDILYRVVDPSSVWIVAKVFEHDLQALRLGDKATISLQALSDRTFEGVVSYIAPALDPETRTADVRIDVANPGGVLRADMFATVHFALPANTGVVAVPNSAIIDSGMRKVVLVAKEGGRFEPREVTTGVRSGDYTAITEGVAENEQVVVDAAFLIDSESNLKAALQSFVPQEPKR